MHGAALGGGGCGRPRRSAGTPLVLTRGTGEAARGGRKRTVQSGGRSPSRGKVTVIYLGRQQKDVRSGRSQQISRKRAAVTHAVTSQPPPARFSHVTAWTSNGGDKAGDL